MKTLTSVEIVKLLNQNPIRDFLALSEIKEILKIDDIETNLIVNKPKNSYNPFLRKLGNSELFQYIDVNILLDLYPEYECVYGPYLETTNDAMEYVLVLCQLSKRNIKLKIMYFKRALKEIELKKQLHDDFKIMEYPDLKKMLINYFQENPKCIRFYNKLPILSSDQKKKILELYPEYTRISNVHYDTTWDSYCIYLSAFHKRKKFKLIHLLYELSISKRIDPSQRVIQKNNVSKDIRIENLTVFDPSSDVFNKWNLDPDKLIEIYNRNGNYKFGGVYERVKSDFESPRRRAVNIINLNTNKRIEMSLAKAKMIVKLDRLLNDNETVDHIDRNYLNDNLDNLRIIDNINHSKQDAFNIEIDPLTCPVCNSIFNINNKRRYEYRRLNWPHYCSFKCSILGKKLVKQKLITPIYFKDLKIRYYKRKQINGKIVKEYFNFNNKEDALKQARSYRRTVPIVN